MLSVYLKLITADSFLVHLISNCPGGGFGAPGGGFGGPGGGFFSTGTSSGFATASTCSKTTPRTTKTTTGTIYVMCKILSHLFLEGFFH